VPADGTRTATVRNGDFGTSPIFGQLSGKLPVSEKVGCRAQKHNGGSRNYAESLRLATM
jgi:hypothetical protein